MTLGYVMFYIGVVGVVLTTILSIALFIYFKRDKKVLLKKIQEEY